MRYEWVEIRPYIGVFLCVFNTLRDRMGERSGYPIERFRATFNLAEGCHMGNPGLIQAGRGEEMEKLVKEAWELQGRLQKIESRGPPLGSRRPQFSSRK